MIELALGPEWAFVILIGRAEDPDSVNMLSNRPPEITDQLYEVMNERRAAGILMQEFHRP